jgi:DHA2 family multidrug resistance protein
VSAVESPAAVVLPPAQRRATVAILMVAATMQATDTTIANVALPRMQGTFSAAQDQMTWVLTSYIVAAAITIPLSGWLADRFGRKRVFLFSILGFTIASALCGMAESLEQIVLFRLLQGVCGAALMPLCQAMLLDIYPKEQYGRAMAMFSIGVFVGPLTGPILGGYLTDHYSWRWVFYINLPLGILATLGVMRIFRHTPPRRTDPFDFFGFATLSIAIGAFQLLLDRGSVKDWFGSTEICLEAAISAFALYLFVVHALTSDHPFVRLALFRDRNFVTGGIFMIVIGSVVFGCLALVVEMLQGLMGYSVIDAGFATIGRSIASLALMIVMARMIRLVDSRVIIAVGFLITAYSMWSMSHFALTMGVGAVFLTSLWSGLGTSMCYVPITTIAFSTIPSEWRNESSSIFGLWRNLGSSAGISLAQTLLVRNTQIQHAVLAEHLTPYRLEGLRHSLVYGAYQHASLTQLNSEITLQAGMVAYVDDFHLMFVLTLLLLPMLLILRNPGNVAADLQHAPVD